MIIIIIIAHFQESRSVGSVRPNSAVLKIRLFNKSENEKSNPAKSYKKWKCMFFDERELK